MIFTFYSYKGGVGRTMAVANIAELLYDMGISVLMIDWDLDSPGLEAYFPDISNKAKENSGLLDMLLNYKNIVSQQVLSIDKDLLFGNVTDYMIDVYKDDGRFIKLLSAGKRDGLFFEKYATEVKLFNWKDFYDNWEGERYFEWFRREVENIEAIVLIDSRSGVNEMSGICTYQLADVVITFTSSNYQSIDGTVRIIETLKSSELKKFRPNRSKLDVVVVPARVEINELEARNKFENQLKKIFDYLLPKNWMEENRSFWDLRIPYVPLYAFEELVATREKRLSGKRISQELVEAFEKIKEAMRAKASPPGNELWRKRKQIDKILIVEDAPAWQELLKEIVTEVGKSYELAINKKDAMSLLKSQNYKLIVLNLNLSSSEVLGFEGIDILDYLKLSGKNLPIIILASESISTSNIYRQYPNVVEIIFKFPKEKGFFKNLSESIYKNLSAQQKL